MTYQQQMCVKGARIGICKTTRRTLITKPMFVTRFAPSPTGLLHLGHAFSALCGFNAALVAKGRLVLRIEDIDSTRCRPEFEAAIYEDLAWLGLEWETPVRRQSEHMSDYGRVLDRLIGMGVMYRCFKTRKALMADIVSAPHGSVAAYRGEPLPADEEAQKLAKGDAFAWRLSLERCRDILGDRWQTMVCFKNDEIIKINPDRAGDVALARKEFPTSYHLASVYDDAQCGITHIVRGIDLEAVLDTHVLLQALLDFPTPRYLHHPLILDDDGKRLAKRNPSMTLRALRESGISPDQIREKLGFNL
jgi:glutamyl-Q tRNA(Asp) synthetase